MPSNYSVTSSGPCAGVGTLGTPLGRTIQRSVDDYAYVLDPPRQRVLLL